MQNELKIALIQSDLVWENPEENRCQFLEKIEGISDDTDIVLLPEMFTSGFTMNPENVTEVTSGETISKLKTLAKKKNMAIAGSLVISEDNNYYNRFVFIHPHGTIDSYNKRHTFTLAGEHKAYAAGSSKTIINYRGWKICPMICYDLRFPVWTRNTEDYDLLIYVANWPKPRIIAWDSLLKARAIENMSYCIGVNRVGEDNNGHQYIGHTTVYDFLGEEIASTVETEEGYLKSTLVKKDLQHTREKLNFLNDRDQFTIKV